MLSYGRLTRYGGKGSQGGLKETEAAAAGCALDNSETPCENHTK